MAGVAAVEDGPLGVVDHVADGVVGVGVGHADDVDRERAHVEAVTLDGGLELVGDDAPLVGPSLAFDDRHAGVGGVVVRAGRGEDGCLCRAVDVIGVFVGREDGVGRLDVARVERDGNHPHRPRRVARPEVRVDKQRRPVAPLENEAVTAQIPDGDGVWVGVRDGRREPVVPVTLAEFVCHAPVSGRSASKDCGREDPGRFLTVGERALP